MRRESYRIRWNNAWQPPLRRSRSFKVTDFGTNQKLLLISSNLPLILHRFQVMVKFSLARGGCLTLTLSLEVFSANIAINDISLKPWFYGLHFCRRKYRCISNHLYVIRPESYRIRWNYAEARAITPCKVIGTKVTDFGTNRKLICDFLLVIVTNLAPTLHRERAIAFNRSKIAIFGYPSWVYPDGEVSWDHLRKKLSECQRMTQGTKWRRNIAENFNRRAQERYRRQTY